MLNRILLFIVSNWLWITLPFYLFGWILGVDNILTHKFTISTFAFHLLAAITFVWVVMPEIAKQMISRQLAPQVLIEKGEAVIRAAGNSMQPIISTGDVLHIKKVDPSKLCCGDAVFCKVNGNKFVHLIKAIDSKSKRFLISNNRGHVNGWITSSNIYGLCTKVNQRVLVSDQDLLSR